MCMRTKNKQLNLLLRWAGPKMSKNIRQTRHPDQHEIVLKTKRSSTKLFKTQPFQFIKKKTLINLSWNQAIAIVLVIEILSMHLLLFRLNSSILSIWNGGTSWITFESERIYIWITNVYKILYYKLTLLNWMANLYRTTKENKCELNLFDILSLCNKQIGQISNHVKINTGNWYT